MEGELISYVLDTSKIEELLSKVIENQDKMVTRLDLLNGLLILIIVMFVLGWIYRYVSNIIGEF